MHSDITQQQLTKRDSKIKNNSVTKTGKWSNSATLLIIRACCEEDEWD